MFSQVRTWKNQATNTVGDLHLVKIDDQADRNIEQFHVAQHTISFLPLFPLFAPVQFHRFAFFWRILASLML
jgi:hypothetical protein